MIEEGAEVPGAKPIEVAADVPLRDDVKVATSRCPFCHLDVAVEQTGWRSCRRCQARHHGACWDEGKRCSACGEARFLTDGAGPRDLDRWGLGVGAAAAIVVLLGTLASYQSRPSRLELPFGPSLQVAEAGLNLAGMLLTALVTTPITLVGAALGIGALGRSPDRGLARFRALALNVGVLLLVIALTIASA